MVQIVDKKTNIASTIQTVDEAVSGVQKVSNTRLTLITLMQEASEKNFISFNYVDEEEENAKPIDLAKLNKIENIHLRYFVKQYENYLGVKWDNKNKDDKAKKEALKDSLVAFIPMLLWSNETLRKQKNSYFVGENNSRIWIDGHYVHKWSKSLNPSDNPLSDLNFSQVMKVARDYYRATNKGGSKKTKSNSLGAMIDKLVMVLSKDRTAIKPFKLNQSNTKEKLSKLVHEASQYISQLRLAQENMMTDEQRIKRAKQKQVANK